jgi:hypothetical protein
MGFRRAHVKLTSVSPCVNGSIQAGRWPCRLRCRGRIFAAGKANARGCAGSWRMPTMVVVRCWCRAGRSAGRSPAPAPRAPAAVRQTAPTGTRPSGPTGAGTVRGRRTPPDRHPRPAVPRRPGCPVAEPRARPATGPRTGRPTPAGAAAGWPAAAPPASRRAVAPSTWEDAWSSHCSSSITQSSGRSPAVSDSRLSTARPTRNRSGGGPAATPSAIRSASRCGSGSRPACRNSGAQSRCRPLWASSISDSTPAPRATRQPAVAARPARSSSNTVLSTPGSPQTTSARLPPPRTDSTSRSSS